MYKVYRIYSKVDYTGYSLIAANTAEEANQMIEDFKKSDSRNLNDSCGYDYVDENDVIENLHADYIGFILHGIDYHPY